MPEQDWNGFADDTVLLGTDVLLVARGASGINVPASSILKKGAGGVLEIQDEGFDEKLRILGANSYFGFYSADGLTRRAYLGSFGTALHYWNDSNGPIILGTNNSERFRLLETGELCLGASTTLASAKVRILSASNGAVISCGNGLVGAYMSNTSGTAAWQPFSFCNNGSSLSQIGSITCTTTTTAYNTSSDYRLKENIVDLEDSGDLIDALRPRRGNWKEDGSDFCGFIAHEFAEVFPASVQGVKDETEIRTVVDEATGEETEVEVPKMQSMQASSSEVMAVVIAELQSLRKRVAELEAAQ